MSISRNVASRVIFPSSVDSQTSGSRNENQMESGSTLPRLATVPILRRSAQLLCAPPSAEITDATNGSNQITWHTVHHLWHLPWVHSPHISQFAIASCSLASHISLLSTDEPRSYVEEHSTDSVDLWSPATEKEYSSVTRKSTWTYFQQTTDMNVLPCMYLFTLK